MMAKKKFAIIIPVFQNEQNVKTTVDSLLKLQDILPEYALQLIFVDDGSTDRSYELLSQYYHRYRDTIRIIKFTKNFGQNAAIQAGLSAADCDCAGIISADLQDPPELFLEMLRSWEKGSKLVIGGRRGREERKTATWLSRVYWKMVRRFAVHDFPIGGFDFCLIDRQVIKEVNRIGEKNTHIFVLIYSLGYPYETVYYTRKKRVGGKSQWTFSKKFKLFMDTFVSFSYLPVKGISYLGLGISMVSFMYAFTIAVSKFVFGNRYEGWTTIVVLISFMSGLILLTLGIIGEYLWRILDETRRRPNYVIDKIVGDD